MTEQSPRSASFAEFWPRYLALHGRPATRAFHYAGTVIGLAFALAALAAGSLILFVIGAVLGYGLAWGGHFLVERNRPATFTHPVWAFAADFKMLWLALTGRLGAELSRLGIG